MLIGIDIGTSGAKAVLFGIDGKVVKSHTVEYPLYQPQNGWAEQNPDDWWMAVVQALKAVNSDNHNITAIGLSGQMHGLVMLDESYEVIRPSIIWCDTRTAKECEEITNRVGAERLIEITANPALQGFSASKILWVRNNEPENYARCKHILLPKDYIRYKLTGELATDVSDASGMQLLDIKNRCWSDEVVQRLGIDIQMLPKVYESPEVTGYVTMDASVLTGIAEGTAVAAGAGDNAAAAVGMGIVEEGSAFTTIGTSGVVYVHTNRMVVDKKGRVHTFCCAVPGKWHVMGVTQGAGLSLKWFRDNFCGEQIMEAERLQQDPYYVMDKLAEQSPIGGGRLIYLPYLMGERTPHLDPNARGVFFGLSAIHKKSDLIRAVMEGVTYSLRDCLEVIKEMGIVAEDMLVCGGGGNSPLWRQMLADVYNCKVKTTKSKEGPALGAALLAGVSVNAYASVEQACRAVVEIDRTETANCNAVALYDGYYKVYHGLYPKLKGAFEALSNCDKV